MSENIKEVSQNQHPASRRWRRFHIHVVFKVPLSFVYRWCTDFGPDDGQYSGEDKTINLNRRIIERTPNRVVFENLYDRGRGWAWERHVVTLMPPDRWHSEGKGVYSENVMDYKLTELPDGRTRLDINWRSRPTEMDTGPRATNKEIENFMLQLWNIRVWAIGRAYEAELQSSGSGNKTT
jgi:hypothetical protein